MNRKKVATTCGAFVLGTGMLLGTGAAQAAEAAEPEFQLPFDCEQTWTGSNGTGPLTSTAPGDPLGINFTKTGDSDGGAGENVWTAAAGKVTDVKLPNSHKGGGDANTVVIDHGDGWSTRYVKISDISVKEGDQVDRGSLLGKVGEDNGLFYLVSRDDKAQKAKFNGKEFQYPKQDVTSARPCG